MTIEITFRHIEATAAMKKHAAEKCGKLQKFLRQPMSAKVTLSLEKLKHVAETQISSGGVHYEAKESSDDMYASIDKVIRKIERQIRGGKGAAQSKKRRGGATLRGGRRPTPLEPGEAGDAAPARSLRSHSGSGKTHQRGSNCQKAWHQRNNVPQPLRKAAHGSWPAE